MDSTLEKLAEYRRLRAIAVGRRRQIDDIIAGCRCNVEDGLFEDMVRIYIRARDAAVSARHAALGAAS